MRNPFIVFMSVLIAAVFGVGVAFAEISTLTLKGSYDEAFVGVDENGPFYKAADGVVRFDMSGRTAGWYCVVYRKDGQTYRKWVLVKPGDNVVELTTIKNYGLDRGRVLASEHRGDLNLRTDFDYYAILYYPNPYSSAHVGPARKASASGKIVFDVCPLDHWTAGKRDKPVAVVYDKGGKAVLTVDPIPDDVDKAIMLVREKVDNLSNPLLPGNETDMTTILLVIGAIVVLYLLLKR